MKTFQAPPGFVLNPDYLVPELEAQRDEARRTVREAHEAGTRLTAQRDALLEALKGLMSEEPNIYEGRLEASLYVTVDALEAARAVIKAVEGEKT